MRAALRLQQQRECRIAADIDPLDRVHLYCHVQAHGVFAAAVNFTLLRNFGFGGYGSCEARLTACIERIGQMPGRFPRRDQNDVKADLCHHKFVEALVALDL